MRYWPSKACFLLNQIVMERERNRSISPILFTDGPPEGKCAEDTDGSKLI
jgi:hypothetical protein